MDNECYQGNHRLTKPKSVAKKKKKKKKKTRTQQNDATLASISDNHEPIVNNHKYL